MREPEIGCGEREQAAVAVPRAPRAAHEAIAVAFEGAPHRGEHGRVERGEVAAQRLAQIELLIGDADVHGPMVSSLACPD